MDNDLLNIYEQHYLGTAPIINESASFEEEEVMKEVMEVVEEAKKKPAFKKKFLKKGKSEGDDYAKRKKVGACYDSTSFDNLFDKIIKEEFGEDDMGGEADMDVGGDDSSFGTDDSYEYDDSDEQVSVSKSTLQAIVDQLQGLIGDIGDEDEFSGNDDMSAEDDIPQESYGFEGAGREHGMQGTYDGKAKSQGKSTLVKGNGDVEFGKQDTGFDPEDTEGSEGSEHGMQDEYDGKAKTQGKSDHVKGDGSINKAKQKTSYKTGSGKKDKNLF